MDLTILDSGYLTRDRSGSQETAANRAGFDGSTSVTAFTLLATSIKESSSLNINNNPTPGNLNYSEIDIGTVENPKYVMSCKLAKNDSTSGFQYSQLYQLRRLVRTNGVKLLYPSVSTDTRKEIVELNGAYNAANSPFQGSGKELTASTPHLIGRITDLSITDNAGDEYFTINMTFIEE